MAKRKSTRKSTKCPEPLNSMIDLAAAATLDYISYKCRKSKGHHTRIDPYAAAGVAIGLGKLNSTEDVIMLGGLLGALGAFDDTADTEHSRYKPINNRYSWRLNCEDGSDHVVYPENYETRAAYNDALNKAKGYAVEKYQPRTAPEKATQRETVLDDDLQAFIFCRISRLDNGINYYSLTDPARRYSFRAVIGR